jgi:hypothetical protein
MIIGIAGGVPQTTGINTIIYSAPTLPSSAGFGNSAALLANIVNGAVNVLLTIAAIRLLDRTGRRPLLLGQHRDGGGNARSRPHFPHRRQPPARGRHLRRDHRAADLHRIIRHRARPGLLAADQRDLPGKDPRPGDERGTMANWGANFVSNATSALPGSPTAAGAI